MKLRSLFCAALLLAGAALQAADTSDTVIEKITARRMVALLKNAGLPGATIDKDDDVIVKIHDSNVLVFVGSFKGTSVKFRYSVSGSKANLRTVNDWNRDKSFTKAFLDKDGDPNLEMDLELAGGVTEARIADAIDTFQQSMKVFKDELRELNPR